MNNSWAGFLYPSQNIFVMCLFTRFTEATKRSPVDGRDDVFWDLHVLSLLSHFK
jgi:hypothetical protein